VADGNIPFEGHTHSTNFYDLLNVVKFADFFKRIFNLQQGLDLQATNSRSMAHDVEMGRRKISKFDV